MADHTITETALQGGRIQYELGRPNWEDRRIPDIRRIDSTVQIPENRLIDVVILGDGFTAAADFRDRLVSWLDAFYDLPVYERFAGAFRIRALHVPSAAPASADRDSFYRCKVDATETGIALDKGEAVKWHQADDQDGRTFRRRLWESVDSIAGLNLRRYPSDLEVGSNQAIGNARLRNLYRNLVVSMFVRTGSSSNVGGMTADVARPSPDEATKGRVALGEKVIHEFSHAFAYLSDEYIDQRGGANTRENPKVRSVLTLSNLSYSNRDNEVPWLHLSPCGRFSRTASGTQPSPLSGWLWVGGTMHTGVWHSEYRCLMNGGHENFQFTQNAALDPTANPDGTFTGASLRDARFCAWCQELVAIRILEKTDRLLEPGDPADATAQGQTWYTRWVDELRPNYQRLFDVEEQIRDAERAYGLMNPGRNGEPLWQSDLYTLPRAADHPSGAAAPPLSDAEMCLLVDAALL